MQKSIRLGNDLLRFTLSAAFTAQATGTAMIIEHPGLPRRADAPSIWKLPEMLHLATLDSTRALDSTRPSTVPYP